MATFRHYYNYCDKKDDMSFAGKYKRLTPRRKEALELLYSGWPNKEIAKKLGIKVGTVKNLFKVLYQELGADTRLQLAVLICDMKQKLGLPLDPVTRVFEDKPKKLKPLVKEK